MMKDLVSIIIPTYKRVDMLDRAIESCLEQTYKNIEILIIDDNEEKSNDRKNTEKHMSKYQNNPQIKYIKRKENGGGAASRNTGIEKSNGTYIAFLDDDDYFLPTKIEEQLKFMKKNKLDASFTANQVYDETQKKHIKEKRYPKWKEYDNILKFHLVEMIVGTQTFMYKKDVLNKIEGFTKVPAGQEYYLMYKTITNNFKVGYLDKVLTTICIHSGERITTSSNKIKAEKFLYDLKRKHFDILNLKQRRTIKYIYKYNIWQKYKTSKDKKQYLWLMYILITHPLLLIGRKI